MLKNLKVFNLPEIEEKVLKFWQDNKIFEKSLIQRKGQKIFRFYEGPPYANGLPGIHHVLARIFKDAVLRYKSMRGYFVPRRAGWDTHGLPIELATEKELGIKSKNEIEKFGIGLFNQKAKASVWKYKPEWEQLTERIGYWLDLKNAYITYENNYLESLWWIFKKIYDKGLLKQSYKIVPYCPRCQTPLSSHELGQPGVYRKTKDPSVYVKFKISARGGSALSGKEFLLVWTTTPWTLPANVAVAVNPKLTYTKYKIQGEYYWSYSVPPFKEGEKVEPIEKISGKKLIGLKYEPLYKNVKCQMSNVKCYSVLGADFVSTQEGTGLVHIAPAFGEDDFNLMKDVIGIGDIPVTVDEKGKVKTGFPGAGKFIKEADKEIIVDLIKKNKIYDSGVIEHEYPFCWRCGAPLIYFSRLSWFIEMSRLREKLLSANKKINWIPEYLKDGRFGEWLKEVKDWAVSRERYWGTPLPIWKCDNGHLETIGGLAELNERRWHKNRFFMMRHGEAEHNLKNMIAAGPEREGRVSYLTEKGKEQAKKAGRQLKKAGIKIDFIISSPFLRTKETSEIVAKELGLKKKIIVEEKLSELDCGVFNWRPGKEHKKFFDSPIEEFVKKPIGGENLNDAKKRMFTVVSLLNENNNNKNILIVGHGDPLWVLEGALRHLPNEKMADSISYPDFAEAREINFDNWPYADGGEVDLHRPYIDSVYLKCRECGEKMARISEVADVWFDSGAMPFASIHYPFENKALIDNKRAFPADFISEGIDQTRGWFYTLLAVSTLLGKGVAYNNVISLGLVLDKNGQKMSKSKGNIVEPWQVIRKYGVDAIRWYFYTINPPAEPKRFDEVELVKIQRQFISLLYNSYVFYESYAKKNLHSPFSMLHLTILDRWILARLQEAVVEATGNFEKYDIGAAAKSIAALAEDLSRWYIRRSRRRFQHSESKKDF
ncbi:MAG: class I tRNA ligase family protein, partial [Candidatus Brennerbacteria bacterium]|nr:class I tRNA ligase family protein [Candidatus Brennerbacteria bacterium]